MGCVRSHTQLVEQVVGTHELLEVGKCRVGFDQILVAIIRRRGFRQALHPSDAVRIGLQNQRPLTIHRGCYRRCIEGKTPFLGSVVAQCFFAVLRGNLAACDAEIAATFGSIVRSVISGLLTT